MSRQSFRRKLEKLESTLPPPPVPMEELPVEESVDEQMQHAIAETTLKNTLYEERFYKILEDLPMRLLLDVCLALNITDYPLPLEVLLRVIDALPPHIERLRLLWADNFPVREHRRRWAAEMERRNPKVKTRDNGYGWWFKTQEDYARLAQEYSGFDAEWPRFYEEWEKTSAPMDGAMRDEFIRICFPGGFEVT